MSRKRAITTFLSRKSMITRLSIASGDFLGSSIAPQVMPPCTELRRFPKKLGLFWRLPLNGSTIKLFVHKTGVLKRVEKELKVRVPSWEMDLQRLKCLHPPSSPLSLIMLQIIMKIILEIIWKIYWQIVLFNLFWN